MKEINYIKSLKEKARSGFYSPKLEEPLRLPLSHVLDPEKSVLWNTEQAAKHNHEIFPLLVEEYDFELSRTSELLKTDLQHMFLPSLLHIAVKRWEDRLSRLRFFHLEKIF